jgi:hypothetical protein
MGIEDLKRWHWIAIGIVLGTVLAGARLMVDPDETNSADTRISAETFVYGVGQKTGGAANLPLFRNIVVYPPVNDLDYVTGEQLMAIPGTRKYQYKVISFHGTRPFRAAGRNVPTVRDFLDNVKKSRNDVSYRYAWWTDSRFVWVTWIGGAVIVVGGVWPTLLNFMIGAGWGRQKKVKETFDLSRFKGESTQAGEEKVVTQQDIDQLRALEAQLEENLKPSGAGHAGTETAATEEPVRQLSRGPVEAGAVAKEEDPNDYKGEFYPVARPHGKKEE